jgi:hypothetical protein
MKVNGVNIEVINTLRADIEREFGSLHAFANLSGYPYSILKRALNELEYTPEEIEGILSAYDKSVDDDDIIPFKKKSIRITIQFTSVTLLVVD